MLRVLQDQRFQRVGGQETLQTRVRVLASTNQDLPRLVEEGRFRKDLYYRLNSVTIHVPPLRARLEDVAELAHYFLFRLNRELGMDLRGLAPDALELLQGCDWPGNVRELYGVMKQAMLNASGHILLPEFLPEHLRQHTGTPAARGKDGGFDLRGFIEARLRAGDGHLHEEVIVAIERVLLTEVLRHTHGHQTQASELLGLSRATLRHKLRALGLAVDKFVVDDADKGA
jgi:two-component system nitrogen regulation response regulator GlnG